jgi:hypothetical protein
LFRKNGHKPILAQQESGERLLLGGETGKGMIERGKVFQLKVES